MIPPATTRAPRRRLDGVLLLDKPPGISSNAALQRARNLYRAQKAGHTGTLDPAASGLLPICFGEATKFAGYLLDACKAYRATIAFGTTTTTGDAEGERLASRPVAFDEVALRDALARFRGPIVQVPPRHSALKLAGRAHYDYARAGIDVPRKPREVTIEAIDLVGFDPPNAVVDVRCSKGTYIRVLAEDLGDALGCGAHLRGLRRTASGGFSLAEAMMLDELETMPEGERDAHLLPVAVLVDGLPCVELDPSSATRFRRGAAVDAPGTSGVCAVFAAGELLGVADVEEGLARPRRVLAEPPPVHPVSS